MHLSRKYIKTSTYEEHIPSTRNPKWGTTLCTKHALNTKASRNKNSSTEGQPLKKNTFLTTQKIGLAISGETF